MPAQPTCGVRAQTDTKVAPGGGTDSSAGLRARPSPVVLPITTVQTPAPQKETYLEIAERLDALIAQQVEAAQRVMDDRALDPQQISMVFELDITGNQQVVCTKCGRHWCTYRPTTYRVQNPEIDLLADALVVFMEVAKRLGTPYGLVVYDEDVLVLREVAPPDDASTERAKALERFHAFRFRHDHPDPKNRAWLDEQLAKWTPEDRTRPRVGEPDDPTALRIGVRLLNASTTPATRRGIIVTKGQVPSTSLRGFEALAHQEKITLSGLAVGQKADLIARSMFAKTAKAHDAHDVREAVADRIQNLVEKSDDA